MQKLTPRQAKILSFIKRCLEDHDFPPARAEIAQELGFKLPNTAEEHLEVLARKGAIETTPGASRGVCIPGFEPHAANDDEGLPMIGRVTAGAPILAEQSIEESYRIDPVLFNSCTDYLSCVHGISMRDIGILDGDLLAVHITRETYNGQVVVARINEEVTARHLKREGSKVWLLTKNPELAPIEVDLREQEPIIEDSSVGVIRR